MNIRKKARELGVSPTTLEYRIKHGWSEDRWGYKRPVPPEGYHVCSKCRHVQVVDQFYPRKGRNGYLSWCKSCLKKTAPKGGVNTLSNVKDSVTL
jgi:hypothetical protein